MEYVLDKGHPWGIMIGENTFLTEKQLANTTMKPVVFDSYHKAWMAAIRYFNTHQQHLMIRSWDHDHIVPLK